MKKWLLAVLILMLALAGCSKYRQALDEKTAAGEDGTERAGREETQAVPVNLTGLGAGEQKKPVQAKGIYISGYMAGSQGLSAILDEIDRTEINTVVIDVKNDDGRITYGMDSPTVKEIGAGKPYIKDMGALMRELKDRGIYTIARVVAFRDPFLADRKPEWSLKNGDGSIYRDNQGIAWVNPYRKEVWDYLVEVGSRAADDGFDEIQFDYIRFSTDSTMKQVVFDPADTKGRSRKDAISEFITYAYDKLRAKGTYVSADVFGTIIGSKVDSEAVGQDYQEMSKHLDYICPMIYPSHYGDGNFGIEHPDTQPYDTILAALTMSKKDLAGGKKEGAHQAVVRPWLQDFTASYLKHYIKYGSKEVREQIQAVYDSGYDEWLLWSAANKYTWDGLLTPEEAGKAEEKIAESRAALPPETTAVKEEATSEDTAALQDGPESGQPLPEETLLQDGAWEPETEHPAGEDEASEKASAKRVKPVWKDKLGKPPVVIITTGAAD